LKRNILTLITLSIIILTILFAFPIFNLHALFTNSDIYIGSQKYYTNYQDSKRFTSILNANIDTNLKEDYQYVVNKYSDAFESKLLESLNISIYYVITISMFLLISGIYIIKKIDKNKIIGVSFIFCGICSLIILAGTSYITYITYFNY